MTPSRRTRFLCCIFLGGRQACREGAAGTPTLGRPPPTPATPDSRHDRRLVQEGLGRHITLNVLHGHLLPQVLALEDRWGGGAWGQTDGNTRCPDPAYTDSSGEPLSLRAAQRITGARSANCSRGQSRPGQRTPAFCEAPKF